MSVVSEHILEEIRELPARYPQPKAQRGQAPPAVTPPPRGMSKPGAGGGPAQPGHADGRKR